MNKFYVYAHSNDEHGVFYVGKGSGKRLFTTGNRSDFWKRIVNKYGYTASIVEECNSEDEAYEKEIFWIEYYKKLGQCSANFSLGGDGVRVKQRWWGNKISQSLVGINRKKGSESRHYKNFADYATLYKLYVEDKNSTTYIAKMFGVSTTTVWERLLDFGVPIRCLDTRGKEIMCVETQQVFSSISQASKSLGVFRENIRKVLSGKYKTTGGLTFVYKEKP